MDFYRFYRVNPEYRTESVRIDAAGFRNDEEVTRDKPKNLFRIVMMGGSTVWGEDAPNREIDNRDTIAAHLETLLNARAAARGSKVKVQVINAGVVGYLLFQNRIYFDHYIAGFHPDLVIAMDGHNDLDALAMEIPPYHHRNEAFFDKAINEPTFLTLVWWGLRYAESKSLFVRKVYLRLWKTINEQAVRKWYQEIGHRKVSDAAIEKWLQEYISTVRRFDASARIAGARVLFTVQAEALGERHKRLTPGELKIREHWKVYQWLHTAVRDRLIARMKKAANRYGFWFEDTSDAFKAEPQQAYLDYTHLTSRGAQVMAERLANLVEGAVFSGAALRSAPVS